FLFPFHLHQLKEEVARLAELRRLNLSVFIENCRNELGHWWDECYLSELQRNVITVEPGEYTETVLSALESEIDRLKVFHALHQPVFDTIKEWQTTFSRFRNTEMKKKDPIVLKNRGGILLRVEKEYKQLQRDLKRLETELHRLASDPIHLELRVHGMPVLEFLDESKRQYDEDKENEVKQKKELQKKIKEIEQRFGCDATRAIYGKRPGTRALPNQTMLARNGPGSATRINAGSSASKKPRMESGKDALSSFASSGTSTLSRELCGSPVASSSFRESTMRSATSGGVRTPRTGTLPKTPQSTSSSLTVAQRIKQQVSHSTTRTALSGHKTTKTPVTSHKLALTSTTTPTRQFLIPSGCPPRSARKL
ncbi:Protein regulator of cytokinesis 1, partial [Fasciola hepatica]